MEVDGGGGLCRKAEAGAPPALVVAPRAAERAHGTERSRPPQHREGGGWRGVLRPADIDDVQCRAARRPDGAGAAGGAVTVGYVAASGRVKLSTLAPSASSSRGRLPRRRRRKTRASWRPPGRWRSCARSPWRALGNSMGQRGRGKRGERRRLPDPLPLVAALIVDNGSGMSMAGYAGSAPLQCPLRLSAGLSCQASLSVLTRRTFSVALVVDSYSGIYRAGFAGIVPRAVFLPVVVYRPQMLGIIAGMDQYDSFLVARRRPRHWPVPGWFCRYCTSRCVLLRCRQAQDAPHRGRYDPEEQLLLGFSGIAPRAVFLLVVYRPEMLGILAVTDQKDILALLWCPASWPVCTRGTVTWRHSGGHRCWTQPQVPVVQTAEKPDFPQLQSIKFVDISFVTLRLIPMVLPTMKIPQLQFLNEVIDCLWYAVQVLPSRCPLCATTGALLMFRSCSSSTSSCTPLSWRRVLSPRFGRP